MFENDEGLDLTAIIMYKEKERKQAVLSLSYTSRRSNRQQKIFEYNSHTLARHR